jgi:DNA-binding SARP family transcriptional activator
MFTFRVLGSASLDGPDGPIAGRAALRQRVALLALLAVEHPRPVSRDRLLAYVWPENGTDDARHLLRDSLYILRSALSDDTVLSTGDELRLNPDRLTCDLREFEAALASNDPDAAVGHYGGSFLSGFHFSGSGEFERWAEVERSRLAGRYRTVLELLAERDTRGGDRSRALEWWSRLAREDPYNSRITLRYMQVLEAAGDRAGALRHAKVHSDLLRAELDAAPEQEVIALAEKLRAQSRAPAAEAPMPTAGLEPTPAELATEPGKPARRGWVAPTVLALVVVVGVGLLGGTLSQMKPPGLAARRVAATPFENRTGSPDLDDLGAIAADWVIRGLLETPVVDASDYDAVYVSGPDQSGRVADSRDLARQSGAGIVVSGSYHRAGDSGRFEASIIDVATGRVLRSLEPIGAPMERATDALELLRRRVAAGLSPLVNGLDRGFPVDPDLVVPPSLPAYREFVAGLKQAQLFGDWEVAAQQYRRAATMDTTFVAPLIQLAFGG